LITVFFGDVSEYTANVAQQYDAGATLLEAPNVEQFLLDSDITVYTSLGDLENYSQALRVLEHADEIHYVPQNTWSDNKKIDYTNHTASTQGLTEQILTWFSKNKNNVYNLDISNYQQEAMLDLLDGRKDSTQPQLWTFGASYMTGSHGVNNNMWPCLLAEQLEMPLNNLSANSASVEKLADQILRSDIQENDIVILSINTEDRNVFWDHVEQKTFMLCPSWAEEPNTQRSIKNIDLPTWRLEKFLWGHDTCFYNTLVKIHQVLNFCRKVRAKVLLFGVFFTDRMHMALCKIPEYYSYSPGIDTNKFIDYADDNKHPGIQQHKLYTNFLYEKLQTLGYINSTQG
jgi:hypothetical protein